MTTLPIETCTAARAASNDDLPLEKAVVEAMAEEMGKSHVWDQGYESMLPSERQKAPKTAASYFDMFFKEKRIPSKVFEVTDSQGITHSIPNKVVIDMIKQTRGSEKAKIEDTLRKIDFANGDVNHFLAHLAKGLAEQYSGTLRFASQQEAEKLEAEAEANEQQAQADRAKAEAAQMRQAAQASGLYGYTKGTQNDVEASVRKAQRRALSVAKTLYARDERSVDFLKAHAKRANSKTARLILAAMKNLGPRVASDKSSDMLPSERHAALGIEAVDPNKYYVSTADGDTYGPYRTEHDAEDVVEDLAAVEVDAAVDKGDRVLKDVRQPKGFELNTPAELKRHHLAAATLPIERVAAKDSAKKEWSRKDRKRKNVKTKVRQEQKKDLAQREKVAGGLYGHPTKTARLALVACSDLRAYVGEVAYSLHSRRTAKYGKVTGFLKEHGKTSKCAYSRMILDCYPDAPVSKQASKAPASEMLKKAFVPDSVDGWLEWAEGSRTAAPIDDLFEMRDVRYPPEVGFIVDLLVNLGFGKGYGSPDAVLRWVEAGKSVPETIADITKHWRKKFKSTNPKVQAAFLKAMASIEDNAAPAKEYPPPRRRRAAATRDPIKDTSDKDLRAYLASHSVPPRDRMGKAFYDAAKAELERRGKKATGKDRRA